MSGIGITIESPDLASFQAEIANIGVIGTQRVLAAMGSGVRNAVIDHFTTIEQDEEHHRTATRLGAQRTHFYGGAVKGVQLPVIESDQSVSVTINSEGIAQRYFGGTIAPTKKQWLTIPAIAEAYGRPAGSFNNLRFIPLGPELAALVERTPATPRQTRIAGNGVVQPSDRESIKGRVVYWLKKSVTQAPDPTVLPGDDALAQAAIDAGRDALAFVKIGGPNT